MAPPFSASKTTVPNARSMKATTSAAARIGKAMRTSTLVMSTVQVKTGIRNIVIPGQRMQKIVVMKLTAPRMVPRPPIARPSSHRSAPTSGE